MTRSITGDFRNRPAVRKARRASARLVTACSSLVVGFLLPAPLTLLSAGLLQGNPGMILQQSLGQPNLVLAYRLSMPFAMMFSAMLAVYGWSQCRHPEERAGALWLAGFLLLGGAFGASALLAFQVAFGGGLFSKGDLLLHLILGGAAGSASALPVAIVWLIHIRHREASEQSQHELAPR